MNYFGMEIPAKKCSDCITVSGQAYCTMNCGPCADSAWLAAGLRTRPKVATPHIEAAHATREKNGEVGR